jgi:sec-independent protein translocase protein TatB
VFGLSFGELCVLIIVAVVVLGPKELPRYLRKAGQFAAKMRRLAYDMREKSGIDEVLRTEGLDRDIAEIRRLARGEVDGIAAAVRLGPTPQRADGAAGAKPTQTLIGVGAAAGAATVPVAVDRAREYPFEGADSYGALPDTAIVYDNTLPASPLADDAVYARGEEPPAAGAAATATATATPEPTTP